MTAASYAKSAAQALRFLQNVQKMAAVGRTVAPYAGKTGFARAMGLPPTPPNSPLKRPAYNASTKRKANKMYSPATRRRKLNPAPPMASAVSQKAKAARRRRLTYYTKASSLQKDLAGPKPTIYDKDFNMKGSVKINENGGTITTNGTGTVYLHHGVASQEFIRSIWRAVIKRIFVKQGCDIRNWNDTPNQAGSGLGVDVHYFPDPSQNINNRFKVSYTFPNSPYSVIADGLMNYVRDNTVYGGDEIIAEFDSIYVYNVVRDSAGTGTAVLPVDIIDLKQVLFDIKVKSDLCVMNRTLAEPNGEEADQDRDDITNIDVVPLKGKVYSGCSTWRNYIELNTRTLSESAGGDNIFAKKLVADPQTGLCQWTSDPTVAANNGQLLGIPARGYVLGYKADKSVYIQPGGMSKNSFTFITRMSFNKIVGLFPQHFSMVSTNTRVEGMRRKFGFIQGYGLEKYLDANRSAGSPINVAYQIKQTYCASLLFAKKIASNPIQYVASTPISYTTDKPT